MLQKLKNDRFNRGLSGIYAVNPNNLLIIQHRKQQASFQPVVSFAYGNSCTITYLALHQIMLAM